jgi:putative phage-type endonuclease
MNDQRSPEWFAARMGKVTASRVSDVMAATKTGPAASRKNYMMELLCQRLTGKAEEGFTSAAMQRGTDLEPIARSAYEVDAGVMVVETGLILHPSGIAFGASPDGLVNGDGLVEIKCPNTATHVEFLRTGKPDSKYLWQMAAQMECAGRAWCDFVSFDDRLPEPLQYRCVRIERDDKKIGEMMAGITAFLDELDELEAEMLEQIKRRVAA